MRRRRRRDGFYPAPDFRDREAEDMAGVFDIDLDQPEDAGSEDELEEGVRPGVPGDVAPGGVGGEPGRRGDRAGVAAWAREAWCVLGRGDPGGRERSPGIAEAPRGGRGRGRGSRRDGGRAGGLGGPGPRCEASAGRAGAGFALVPRAAQPRAMCFGTAEEERRALGS